MSKKIAVLLGGLSSEREVSLKTGAAVVKALKTLNYDVTEIDVGFDVAEKLKAAKPDIAFIALHGSYGEDGCVQGLLELMRIPYTHSSAASSAVCMDKEFTQTILKANGISTAPHAFGEIDEMNFDIMPTPFVLKPIAEGSSVGVSIIRTEPDLAKAKTEWKFGRAMVEKFIEGRELSVAVLDEKALGVIELKPHQGFYDYTNKYTSGKTEHIMPAPLSAAEEKTVKEMAEKAHKIMRCSGISRSDFRFDGKNFYILEINTHPGMTELSLAPEIANYAGIKFPELIEILVKKAKYHNN